MPALAVFRRGLIDNLGGLLGGDDDSNTNSVNGDTSTQGGGLLGSLTDGLNPFSLSLPPVGPQSSSSLIPSSSSSLPLTSSSSSSSSSLPVSTSSVPSSTSTPPPSSSSQPPTTSDTSTVVLTSYAPTPSDSGIPDNAATTKTFLENKPLSIGVFVAVGIVALILSTILITTCVRRRTRNRLNNEAIDFSFDPKETGVVRSSAEKLRNSGTYSQYNGSQYASSQYGGSQWGGSQSTHAHYADYGYATQPAAVPAMPSAYMRQDYGLSRSNTATNPGGYMPNPYTTYGNPIPQQRTPSPNYGAAGVGGAQLGRSLSDRKPVPPLPSSTEADNLRGPTVLPDTFGYDDVYGGTANNSSRGLQIANE